MTLFLLLLFSTFFPSAQCSRCLDSKSNPRYSLFPFGKTCYFVLQGAIEQANSFDNSSSTYFFNVDVARAICANDSNATLPIVRNLDESVFLADEVKFERVDGIKVQHIALGLNQSRGKYHWDDGTNLTYEERPWVGKEKQGLYTRLVFGQRSKGPPEDDNGTLRWENAFNDSWTVNPVLVLCRKQQEVDDGEVVKKTDCDNYPTKHKETKKFESESCFFIPKDSHVHTNRLVNNKYVFNVTAGRNLCKMNQATLPIIQSGEENVFLASAFHHPGSHYYIPLGLNQISYTRDNQIRFEYFWDNGELLYYEAFFPTKFEQANYTFISDNEGTWSNQNQSAQGSDQPVEVVCQQRYHDRYFFSGPIENKCTNDTSEKYPKSRTLPYKGKVCYFVVAYVTELTNSKMDNESYQFNIWKARLICHHEHASLVTIHTKDEADFIHSMFGPIDFGNITIGIALDMIQLHTDEYLWSDNRSLAYKAPVWYNNDSYAYYTVMLFEENAWLNVPSRYFQRPIAVLCKQVFELSTTTAKTRQPTKTTSVDKEQSTTKAQTPTKMSASKTLTITSRSTDAELNVPTIAPGESPPKIDELILVLIFAAPLLLTAN